MATIRGARFVLTDGNVETDKPVPALNTETLTLGALRDVLGPEVAALSEGFEYFSLSTALQYDNPGAVNRPMESYTWLACYAVTGSNEGHYVHVDRIYRAEPYARELSVQPLFLAKTFGGYEDACRIAAHIGARLGA